MSGSRQVLGVGVVVVVVPPPPGRQAIPAPQVGVELVGGDVVVGGGPRVVVCGGGAGPVVVGVELAGSFTTPPPPPALEPPRVRLVRRLGTRGWRAGRVLVVTSPEGSVVVTTVELVAWNPGPRPSPSS